MSAGRLVDEENRIREQIRDQGFAITIALMYKRRMLQLKASGDLTGSQSARHWALHWADYYMSQATSGGERTALQAQRNAFVRDLDIAELMDRAEDLEAQGRLTEAEQLILTEQDSTHRLLTIAYLYKRRIFRLKAAGQQPDAGLARARAIYWAEEYISQNSQYKELKRQVEEGRRFIQDLDNPNS